MGITQRNRKRILIFLLIPILSAIQVLTEDLVLRAIAGGILVIYVGFIVFLRDSVRNEEPFDVDTLNDAANVAPNENSQSDSYDTDTGEDFKIVSKTTKIEVQRAESLSHSFGGMKKVFFKPPDLKENFEKIAGEELPANLTNNEQFIFVLEKILTVIKDAFLAHSAVFFWYKQKTKKITLEKFVSQSNEITEQKFDLDNDILSRIITNEEPELLTDITPMAETDVLRYYNSPQNIKSFVGVPLFYNKHLIGVLGLDSKSNDTFGIETIYSLGKFVRVIAILIALYEEKHVESLSKKRLNVLLGILSKERKFLSPVELVEAVEATVKELIDWDVFCFVQYFSEEHKFKTSKIINRRSLKYVGENLEVDITETLTGKAIKSLMPVKVGNTSEHDFLRYSASEDIGFDGSFLAIPLSYDNQVFGVLCFESLKNNFYSNSDIKFLQDATKIFGFILYSFTNNSVMRSLLSVDIETKALNFESFVSRVENELVKAKEVNASSVLVLIRIDDFLEEDTLFESNPFDKVLKAIHKMIMEEITPLSLLGRLDNRVFGIFFFNQSSKNIFLWAEKLRIKIARMPIAVVSKQTTFTVSMGVAAATGKTDSKELLYNAELALKKAMEKGGNTVKSIN